VRVSDSYGEEFPDGDRASTEAFATLTRAGLAVLGELDRCIESTFGVSHPVITALAVVEGAGEPLTPSQISERMLVPSATMTATLDVLEDRGWVVRRPNPADRRSVLVEITAAGRATADQFLPGIRLVERDVMSGLTERENKQLLAILAKVLARAAEVAEAPPRPLEGRRVRPSTR
jgi:DNA-binding MarR family transcriptional regulator